MTYDPEKHHRRSIRLPGYDYRADGYYFVTLVTEGRQCLFDQPTFRQIAETYWSRLPRHFPHLQLDEWVLMPNHLHAILMLAGLDLSTAPPINEVASGSLGAILGNYKLVTTRRLNTLRKLEGRQVWQRNYHDRIIRSETELRAIRQYIRDNPARWSLDEHHPTTA